MVLNPNYNSDDDDWDMVSPGGEGEQNTAETEATAGVSSEVPPSAPSSEEEDLRLVVADSMDVPDAEEAQATKVESQPDTTIVPSETEVEEVQKEREREAEISSIPADSSMPTTTRDNLGTNTTDTSSARDVATETAEAPAEEMAPLVIGSDAGAPESKPKEAAAAPTTTPPARTFTTRPTPRAASGWSLLLGSSLKKVGSALQELDEKHDLKLQETARRSLRVVRSSAQELGRVVETETKQVVRVVERESRNLSRSVQTRAQAMELDHKVKVVEAKAFRAASVVERNAKQIGGTLEKSVKTAGASIQSGVKCARDRVQDLNKDGKVTDVLTAVAVVGAGVLLAKSASGGGGNAGAAACGAAVLGTAGAAYMANQAVQEHTTRRYEATLNEDLHME